MGSLKNFGNRLFHFIAGLVITILGIIFIIAEFSSKVTADTDIAWPFIVFIFGIAWIGVAFDKHKKAQKLAQNDAPTIQPNNNNNAAPAEVEHKPPPINQG